MTLTEIANTIREDSARVVLMYAFNSTGKTQLCVAFKNATKREDGTHTGVYYNAFSEDLFVWDNDEAERRSQCAAYRASQQSEQVSRARSLKTTFVRS